MPRAKKDHSCLNIKIDAALYRRLMEVSEEAGQTKTMVVERALQEKSLEISENYVSHLGEDLLRPDKLEDMIHIMRSGEAATVSGAIACYREIGKAPARKE